MLKSGESEVVIGKLTNQHKVVEEASIEDQNVTLTIFKFNFRKNRVCKPKHLLILM